MFKETVEFIRNLYSESEKFIPLHALVFNGNDKKYLKGFIDSTFVSSVGIFIDNFEELTAEFSGSKHVIAISNGMSALQIALFAARVRRGDEIITQPLTFVATPSANSHCVAKTVFLDVDMGFSGPLPGSVFAKS